MLKFLEFLRSLGFGGFVGAGVAGFLFLYFPSLFGAASFYLVVGIGAGIGGGLQKLIEKGVKFVLHPLSQNDDYYEKLDELRTLRATNQISEAQYQDIVAKLTEKRFVGSTITNDKTLPAPPTEKRLS
jgi:hypothetical protein